VLKRSEVCKRLGIGKDEFVRLARTGELPAIRTGDAPNSPYRVSERDLEEYIERRRVVPTGAAS